MTGSHPSHDSGIIAEGGPESGFSQDSLLEVKQGVSAPCLNFTGKQIQQNDIDRIGRERLLADLPPLEPAASGSGEYRTIPFQVLSWYPRIVLFPKFLDHDKCDHVIDLGRARLGISGLVLRKGETTSSTADIRTRWAPVMQWEPSVGPSTLRIQHVSRLMIASAPGGRVLFCR